MAARKIQKVKSTVDHISNSLELQSVKNNDNESSDVIFTDLKKNYENFYKIIGDDSSDDDDDSKCPTSLSASLQLLKSKAVAIEMQQKKVLENTELVNKLEKQMIDKECLLKNTKDERLNLHKKETETWDKNDDLFSHLFLSECIEKCEGGSDQNSDESPRDTLQDGRKKHRKNFIRRNIGLAATAMSKLSLTDKEKQRLEEMLLEEDAQPLKNEKENVESIENKDYETFLNAFRLCEEAENRISEIDIQLQNYGNESQQLKTTNGNLAESFWKHLILEQMLSDIDKKLAALKEENDVNETKE